MSQTEEVRTGVEISAKSRMESPVKPVSDSLDKDKDGDSEQVVNSATTTTTTIRTSCQEINKDITPSDDVTTNSPEENTGNITSKVTNSIESVEPEQQSANINAHNVEDLSTLDVVTKSIDEHHEGDASPDKDDLQEKSNVSNDDTAETTTTSGEYMICV